MTALTDALRGGSNNQTPAPTPPSSDLTTALKPSATPAPNLSLNAPPAPAPGETGNSLLWDIFHPKPADLTHPQSWRDWATSNYTPTAYDVGTSALDDVSMGSADWLQSKATGEDVDKIRARTADAQAAMGPASQILNAATYVIPGAGEAKIGLLGAGKTLGKVAQLTRPVIGRTGAAATEGALASGLSSAGHQLGSNDDIGTVVENVGEDMTKGAAFGVGGRVVGSTLKHAVDIPVVKRVADFVNSNPGRANDPLFGITRSHLNAGADVSQDIANQIKYRSPNDPMQPGLQKAFDATQQSTEPGWLANRFADAASAGARTAMGHAIGPVGWMMDNPAQWARGKVLDVSRGINEGARTEAVHSGLDQAVRDQTGQPLTVNTQNWPDVWKNMAIGGSRAPIPDSDR